jgi:hypothetical protein
MTSKEARKKYTTVIDGYGQWLLYYGCNSDIHVCDELNDVCFGHEYSGDNFVEALVVKMNLPVMPYALKKKLFGDNMPPPLIEVD